MNQEQRLVLIIVVVAVVLAVAGALALAEFHAVDDGLRPRPVDNNQGGDLQADSSTRDAEVSDNSTNTATSNGEAAQTPKGYILLR